MLGNSSRNYPIVKPFFVGGVGDEVTASSTILKIEFSDGRVNHIMLDAGAAQGEEEYRNLSYPINGERIDAIILTHSHYDHIGDLALLRKTGFNGNIYLTNVSRKISYPMLVDAAKIQENKAHESLGKVSDKLIREMNKRLEKKRLHTTKYRDMKSFDSAISQLDKSEFEPLYTGEDVEAVRQMFKKVKLNTYTEILPGVKIRMLPTTHQNGAVRTEVHVEDPNGNTYGMAFSGDIGPDESLLYEKKHDYTSGKIDCLVLETLHGVNPPDETLKQSIIKLYDIIRRAKRKKQHVVLMGFSLDRNAMLVYLLNCLIKCGIYIDVVLDSPLTMSELEIYQQTYSKDSEWFKDLGKNPFSVDNFKVVSLYRDHVQSVLHGEAPRVIITASANGNGGRVLDYFENCLDRKDYIFVVCGWVAPNSPTNLIYECEEGKMISVLDRTYIKRCQMHRLHGFTSHGYYPEMLSAVNDYPNLKTLILNHARTEDKVAVAKKLSETYGGEIFIPNIFESYELSGEATVAIDKDTILSHFDEVVNKSILMSTEEFRKNEE